MRCIPTHVRAAPDDPERVRALCALVVELRARRLADEGGLARWQYLCSTPFGRKDGSVGYLHVFRDACNPDTGESLTLGIAAARSWWPHAGCEILSPPRSRMKAQLRLVS
jgi:hypothetical protein